MATVKQPTINPTNKLSAAIIGASLAAMLKAIVTNRYPYLGDPVIWEPMPIVVAAVAGYFVKDAPNVQVTNG